MNALGEEIFAGDAQSKMLEHALWKQCAEATLRHGGRAEDVEWFFRELQEPCLPAELHYTYGPIGSEVERRMLADGEEIRQQYREKLAEIGDASGYLDAMLPDIIAEQKVTREHHP